jgi:hypothetical protein
MTSPTADLTREFWVSSGHHLARRTPQGRLAVTPELLLAYLARPELAPPEEACDAERALYAALRADPLRAVSKDDIAAMADADARENWEYFRRYRDLLVSAGTIEDAYIALFSGGRVDLPPLFIDQMTHIILRNALDGCTDPYVLRAGELFYRAQKASLRDGALLLADLELIEEQARDREALRHVSPLTMMLGGEPGDDLDVMDDANAWTYWSRSDANSMVLNLGTNPAARAGLARVIAAWVEHLTGARVSVEPVAKMEDRDWRWFVGLDAEGTRIGNAIWSGEALPPEDVSSIAALFRMEFANQSLVREKVRGKPVWLLLGMTPDKVVRMKPQNLLVGLPLVTAPAARGSVQ